MNFSTSIPNYTFLSYNITSQMILKYTYLPLLKSYKYVHAQSCRLLEMNLMEAPVYP